MSRKGERKGGRFLGRRFCRLYNPTHDTSGDGRQHSKWGKRAEILPFGMGKLSNLGSRTLDNHWKVRKLGLMMSPTRMRIVQLQMHVMCWLPQLEWDNLLFLGCHVPLSPLSGRRHIKVQAGDIDHKGAPFGWPLLWLPFCFKTGHRQIFPACANHMDQLGVILVIYFTLHSRFLCALEYHVVYNWTCIIISAQMGLRGQKIWRCLFFFSSLWQQPTNQGPVRHSDPGTPLASSLKKSYEEHIAKLEALNVAAKDKA